MSFLLINRTCSIAVYPLQDLLNTYYEFKLIIMEHFLFISDLRGKERKIEISRGKGTANCWLCYCVMKETVMRYHSLNLYVEMHFKQEKGVLHTMTNLFQYQKKAIFI